MKLANRIINLRERKGWSQDDLALMLNTAVLNVADWERGLLLPDLDIILQLSEIFDVTSDYLLKGIEDESVRKPIEKSENKLGIEEVSKFFEAKRESSQYIAIGVVLCVYSVVPLFLLLSLVPSQIASALGLTALFSAVAIAISFFLRGSRFQKDVPDLEKESFELTISAEQTYKEKLEKYHESYTQLMAISIAMLIGSVIPLILSGIFSDSDGIVMFMLVLMFLIVGAALYLMIPAAMKNSAYKTILQIEDFAPQQKEKEKDVEKFGAFYWPLVTAVYLGWSFLTMSWHISWIIWPLAGLAFSALNGLAAMLSGKSST